MASRSSKARGGARAPNQRARSQSPSTVPARAAGLRRRPRKKEKQRADRDQDGEGGRDQRVRDKVVPRPGAQPSLDKSPGDRERSRRKQVERGARRGRRPSAVGDQARAVENGRRERARKRDQAEDPREKSHRRRRPYARGRRSIRSNAVLSTPSACAPCARGAMRLARAGIIARASRRGGRAVEGARLESVYTGNRIVGSNPTPSASPPVPDYSGMFGLAGSVIVVFPPLTLSGKVENESRWTALCLRLPLWSRSNGSLDDCPSPPDLVGAGSPPGRRGRAASNEELNAALAAARAENRTAKARSGADRLLPRAGGRGADGRPSPCARAERTLQALGAGGLAGAAARWLRRPSAAIRVVTAFNSGPLRPAMIFSAP